ncbi:DUF1611 domain-containing protein [Microcoleus sp. FACHB-1515]|uniref:DUF1611 domain-containing protein n=1 Tax=Cyanophyceae TaxID=3028117 RepID=UPI001684DB9F|nr:DUF1611 domain-containing protein [Microcoleus sp. FACHB-1515]MBD2090036.1 DUF1611 domain-containing protein [Microcoleus sp. FACHB-1515]
MLKAEDRVAILLHDGLQSSKGKTGLSLLRYSELAIVAVVDRQFAGQDLEQITGIARQAPIVASVEEAIAYQPTVLSIGIAPSGGALPDEWMLEIRQAIASGLSIVNGLHTAMSTDPELANLLHADRWIWDVRREPQGLSVGTGAAGKLSNRRVLTVGTDMSVGKMSASLELNQAAKARGMRSTFLATGQTGLMLGHDGVPLDAVRVDFAAGAIEQLVMRHADAEIVWVEGQGSLMNPASTATLPLLRGTQPTHLVLVHRAGQSHIYNVPDVPIPPLPKVIQVYETIAAAGGAFAETKVAAIALNTHHLDLTAAKAAIEQAQAETGLPCTDVIRFGAESLLDAIVS